MAHAEQHPGHLPGTPVLHFGLLVPARARSWQRARTRVGDTYLHQVRFAGPSGTLLLRASRNARTRDRATPLSSTLPV